MAKVVLSGNEAGVQLSAEDVLAALDRVLASPSFENSERLCRFLRFVVRKTLEGEGAQIKEYLIAMEVYARPSSYDPKVDSIVRVEASRLRTKLREHYETTGREDELRIELPKGSYVPVFRGVAPRAAPMAEPPPAEPSLRRYSWRSAALIFAVVIAGAGFLQWRRGAPVDKPAPEAGLESIAVLPFLSVSPEKTSQAFADGLTEDITESLAKVKQLRVAGRAAASQFKGKSGSIPVLGRQLKVGAILEGSVRQDQRRVRITAQLVSTLDGFHLWSETYDRESTDVFQVQSEIARRISETVAGELARAAASTAGVVLDKSGELELFRKGMAILDWQSDHMLAKGPDLDRPQPLADLMRSISYFEQLVAHDPKHARGLTGLAHAYSRAAEYDSRMNEKARSAAERALKLDPKIGVAHSILGYGLFLRDWNFPAAERELRRALELDSRLVGMYRLYGDCASLLGRQQEALDVIARGQMAFPNEPLLELAKAAILFHARRYGEQEEVARRLMASAPKMGAAHWLLGLTLQQQGRLGDAIREFEAALRESQGDPRATTALGHALAAVGRRNEALAVINGLTKRPAYVRPAYSIAMIHAGLGDRESAFEWLQRSFDQHETSLPYMKLDPRLDNLRGDARFAALLKKLRL